MSMKDPPHPGRGLKDDIGALGITVAEAAEALGITRQQLYNVVAGRSGITPERP
jgi:antitoxin HigA-1